MKSTLTTYRVSFETDSEDVVIYDDSDKIEDEIEIILQLLEAKS